MNKNLRVYGSSVLGIVFVIIAIMYWTTPAGSLPGFFPGYAVGSAVVHVKHGLGSIIIGAALFIYAWFGTGKKS